MPCMKSPAPSPAPATSRQPIAPRGKPYLLLVVALLLATLWLSGCAADSGWGSSFKMAP